MTTPGPVAPGGSTTVDRYRLARPTRASTLAALTRVFGGAPADALWREAVRDVADPDDEQIAFAALRVVCDRLAAKPGLVGVLGSALRVRCDTYACLESLE